MADPKEEVRPVSESGPTTSPKYVLIDRFMYAHLDNIKKTLDAMQGVTGGIAALLRIPEVSYLIPIIWIIKYYLGVHLDKCKVKNPIKDQ
jgi:hypothetical protein